MALGICILVSWLLGYMYLIFQIELGSELHEDNGLVQFLLLSIHSRQIVVNALF